MSDIENAFNLVDKFKEMMHEPKPEPKYYHKDISLSDGYAPTVSCLKCPYRDNCWEQCKDDPCF